MYYYFMNCNYPCIYHVRFVADEVEPVSPCCLFRAKTVAIVQMAVSLPVSPHLRQERSKAPWLLFPSPPRQRRWVSMSWPTFKCWGLSTPKMGLRSPGD